MDETNTYQNWRAVTEADFVSLFIKTWFAYISTLRVMYPEAKNKRGDGKFLKTHKEHYKRTANLRLVVDDQIQRHIETVYSQGRKIIMEQYPEYEGSDTPTGLTAVESGQWTVDSWYSIDGKKLQGEPTKKGVYIIKGKKVKKEFP